ncbi:LysR substrate binding domain family protein [Lactobacillus equicursoris 66c]|uniref:LysR substrate binding domain family protein n=1 Tax=Lactobacillus equicursoris 66c TaxID=872326 RepID=K0NFI2_9LACO|nr:LysR family transcriptional regulator [Lactobacillus equicursoris]CCK83972.1 LysR substrate binding domain family protein [Lactobacillus equicursoris 66c]
MEISKLQTFASLAETLSFSQSADELFLTQGTVSKQIVSLEKEFGLKLFERNNRSVRLAKAGRRLLPYAQKEIAVYQELLDQADQCRQEEENSLELYAIPTMTNYHFFKLATQFLHQYPEVDLNFHEDESVNLKQELKHPQDLLFMRKWHEDFNPADEYIAFEADPLVVLVSDRSRFAKEDSISLNKLKYENFLTLSDKTKVKSVVQEACRQAGFEPEFSYQGERVDAILQMAKEGLGVAILMDKAIPDTQLSGLTKISLKEKIISTLYLVRKKGKHNQVQNLFWQEMADSVNEDDSETE